MKISEIITDKYKLLIPSTVYYDLLADVVEAEEEQEPCEDCDYSEIMDWEQDTKTGKAKPIYWCERHKEPCDDAISRKTVLELAYDMSEIDGEHYTEPCMVVDVDDIQKLPSVRPIMPEGKWIYQEGHFPVWWKCSECGMMWGLHTDYCPACGANMKTEEKYEEKD